MASLLTGTPITYNGEEAMDYIMRPAIASGNIENFFKIVPNVKEKQQVIFLNPIYKITHTDAGCGSGPVNPTVTRSQKYWTPDPMEVWLDQCYTDFVGTLHEKQLKGGTDRPDLTGTEVEKVMLELATPATYSDFARMAWLDKKTIIASELTNGSADVTNYNQTDGIWTKIYTGVGASLIPRQTISENGNAAGSQGLTDGSAILYLKKVVNGARTVLKQVENSKKVLFVTRSIYEDYESYLESKGNLESSFTKLQDGQMFLTYRGIRLEIVDVVDQFLAADFAPSGVIDKPNRIILTVKDNFQIGVDTGGVDTEAFDIWFERMTKKWNARLNYKLCTQIALEELVSVAY